MTNAPKPCLSGSQLQATFMCNFTCGLGLLHFSPPSRFLQAGSNRGPLCSGKEVLWQRWRSPISRRCAGQCSEENDFPAASASSAASEVVIHRHSGDLSRQCQGLGRAAYPPFWLIDIFLSQLQTPCGGFSGLFLTGGFSSPSHTLFYLSLPPVFSFESLLSFLLC